MTKLSTYSLYVTTLPTTFAQCVRLFLIFWTEINIEWRPAGEFVQGGVSNVQRHGFAALNIDHLPKELKRLFKKAGIKKKQLKKNPELVRWKLKNENVVIVSLYKL